MKNQRKKYKIGKQLREAMQAKGVSDSWLAYQCEVSTVTASSWMHNKTGMLRPTVLGIEQILDCKLI